MVLKSPEQAQHTVNSGFKSPQAGRRTQHHAKQSIHLTHHHSLQTFRDHFRQNRRRDVFHQNLDMSANRLRGRLMMDISTNVNRQTNLN